MHRCRRPHGPQLLALCALLAALLLAACGGSDSASDASGPSPAALAPADSVVYGELLVRPSGDVEDGVVAAARKVLRVDDIGAELRRLIDEGLAETEIAGRPSFARDIEPWLGDRIGIFVLLDGAAEDEPNAGFVAAVRDRDALEQELARLRDAGELRDGGSTGGVAYDLTDDDEPAGIVDGQLVFASSLDAFRAAVAASGGANLADESRYTDAVDDVADDAIAFLYLDPKVLAEGLRGRDDVDPQARALFASPAIAQADPVAVSLTADADEIVVEATSDLVPKLSGDEDSDAEVSVGQLPGDAWLALATPPLGPIVQQALESAGVSDLAAEQVRQAMGLDLNRDLLDPLGGLGLFARGTNPLDIGGGALLQLTDADAAQRLMTRIQALAGAGLGAPARSVELNGARGFELQIPPLPQPIVVLAKGDRIAAGYAASSAQDLLEPKQRFDDGGAGKAAIDTLGDGFTPSFVLLVPQVAELLQALDQLEVADLSSVLPYVEAYRSLAIGTKTDGDRQTVRAVATLR